MLDSNYIKAWEQNKEKVKQELSAKMTSRNNFDGEYIDILKSIVTNVLNEVEEYNTDKITVIDDGDYQGTLIFAIPRAGYQPAPFEYIFCYVSYGSCCCCDALQGAKNIEDIMQIALHLFQSMKFLWEFEEWEMGV